jgi:anti-sigma regulatory factor (Ser/Thr protein kinase)
MNDQVRVALEVTRKEHPGRDISFIEGSQARRGMSPGVPPLRSRQFDMAMALQQAALSVVTRLDADLGQAMMRANALPDFSVSPSRVFAGTPDQIRAVRDYVRIGFAGHPAAEDAVLAASELATNSVEHSASGLPGGIFLLHLARLSPCDVGIIVTDQGGTDHPRQPNADVDSESGRGLAVVHSLSSLLAFSREKEFHSVLAVISSIQRRAIEQENQPCDFLTRLPAPASPRPVTNPLKSPRSRAGPQPPSGRQRHPEL